MPDNTSTELDASFVSIYRETELSEKVHRQILQALSFLPLRFKQELADLGVKIILAPTILEILPTLDMGELTELLGNDDRDQCERWAKSWPCIYTPPTKTIYIAEEWVGYRGNTVDYSVLNRCAFAYQKSTRLTKSNELHTAIIDDLECVPGDLQPSKVSDTGEFFAAMWAAVIIADNSKNKAGWAIGLTSMFPRTAAFVRQKLDSFQ